MVRCRSKGDTSENRSEIRRNTHLTNDLIDQIIYKLYGLTEDEIAIVEGRA